MAPGGAAMAPTRMPAAVWRNGAPIPPLTAHAPGGAGMAPTPTYHLLYVRNAAAAAPPPPSPLNPPRTPA